LQQDYRLKTHRQNPTVALIRCGDYSQPKLAAALTAQFELLGGLKNFVNRGDKVLLKPNFITPKSRRCAAQTDPAVILEVARLIKDFGAEPFVGDSPAWGNISSCVKALKFEEQFKKLGIAVKQLNRPKICRIGPKNTKVAISSLALDADVIINLPKFKSHQQIVATFAVKNMFGCVCGKQKAWWHFAKGSNHFDFCRLLIEIYKFLGPALTRVDGIIAMDGPGPISGRARPLGWLIGSTEPIACEIICSRLINLPAGQLPIVQAAKRIGFSCCDTEKINLVGDDFPVNTCSDFEHAKLIPIRFTLPRILRSIAKQMLLLAKSRAGK
jgi:uncharacterized protein (DUF362 family)